MPNSVRVVTPQGEAEVLSYDAAQPQARVVLTHGAGGDVSAPDLVALAESLPSLGFTVSLVRMPWRVAGKKLAPRPAVIDESYRAILDGIDDEQPLILGGRSAGARSACRIAHSAGARAVLALSFPLHPPGKPEKTRLEELLGAGLPTLVIQGDRDPFGAPGEFPDPLPEGIELVGIPSADHSLKVPKRADISAAEVTALVQGSVLEWLTREVPGNP